MDKTLVLIKPDGTDRNLIGKIISSYEEKGLVIEELRSLIADEKRVSEHYMEHKDKSFYQGLIDSFLGKKIVAMTIAGNNAIEEVRKINGATDPLKAEKGTIRGDFGLELPNNTVHASDSIESFNREYSIWFR